MARGVAHWGDRQDHRVRHRGEHHQDHQARRGVHRQDHQVHQGQDADRRNHLGVHRQDRPCAADSHRCAEHRPAGAPRLLRQGHRGRLGERCSRRRGEDRLLSGRDRCAVRCWTAVRRAEEGWLCRTLRSGGHLRAAAESGGQKRRSVALAQRLGEQEAGLRVWPRAEAVLVRRQQ